MNRNKYLARLGLSIAVSASMALNAAPIANAAELSQAQNAAQIHYGVISESDIALLRGLFDAEYYKKTNPDVVNSLGDNADRLFEHFVKCGLFEGRSLNQNFNVSAYASAYEDLSKVFGSDIISYYRHYALIGAKENRTITTLKAAADAGITVTSVADNAIVIKPEVVHAAEKSGETDLAKVEASLVKPKPYVPSSDSSSSDDNSSSSTTDDKSEEKTSDEKKDTPETNGDKDSQSGEQESGTTEGGSTEGGSTEGGSSEGGSTEGGSTEGGSTEGGSGTGETVVEKTEEEKLAEDKALIEAQAANYELEVAHDTTEDDLKITLAAYANSISGLNYNDWAVDTITGFVAGQSGSQELTVVLLKSDVTTEPITITVSVEMTDAQKLDADIALINNSGATLEIDVPHDATDAEVRAELAEKVNTLEGLYNTDWQAGTLASFTEGMSGPQTVIVSFTKGEAETAAITATVNVEQTDVEKVAADKVKLYATSGTEESQLKVSVPSGTLEDDVKTAIASEANKLEGLNYTDWVVDSFNLEGEGASLGTAGQKTATVTFKRDNTDATGNVTVLVTVGKSASELLAEDKAVLEATSSSENKLSVSVPNGTTQTDVIAALVTAANGLEGMNNTDWEYADSFVLTAEDDSLNTSGPHNATIKFKHANGEESTVTTGDITVVIIVEQTEQEKVDADIAILNGSGTNLAVTVSNDATESGVKAAIVAKANTIDGLNYTDWQATTFNNFNSGVAGSQNISIVLTRAGKSTDPIPVVVTVKATERQLIVNGYSSLGNIAVENNASVDTVKAKISEAVNSIAGVSGWTCEETSYVPTTEAVTNSVSAKMAKGTETVNISVTISVAAPEPEQGESSNPGSTDNGTTVDEPEGQDGNGGTTPSEDGPEGQDGNGGTTPSEDEPEEQGGD